MKLTEDEVLQVLRLLENSSFDELDLQMGEMRLRVRRRGAQLPGGPLCAPEPLRTQVFETFAAVAVAEPTSPVTPAAAAPDTADKSEEGLLPIKAPMVGTFFARPSPDEPPFVEVGARLEAEDTVCLLEVMKVFNTVKAGVRGRLVKACVQNGQFVEYGQALYLVEPDDDPETSQAP